MGRLVAIVGNTGVGKTTLTHRLAEVGNFLTGLEQHAERPFQRAFRVEHQRYALANQIDYMLFRAEQELTIRQSQQDGVQDGGLELDFYVFTHLFCRVGYLNAAEFYLCERQYTLLRTLLPPPDLIVWMVCPHNLIVERFARRGRGLEIANTGDLETIESLLSAWMAKVTSVPVIKVDASVDDPNATSISKELVRKIHSYFGSTRQ